MFSNSLLVWFAFLLKSMSLQLPHFGRSWPCFQCHVSKSRIPSLFTLIYIMCLTVHHHSFYTDLLHALCMGIWVLIWYILSLGEGTQIPCTQSAHVCIPWEQQQCPAELLPSGGSQGNDTLTQTPTHSFMKMHVFNIVFNIMYDFNRMLSFLS